MADTLKFGPEWLRQLSGGNSVGTPPPSPAPGFGKYKLAEYRYGREEMLALFTQSQKMPEELAEFSAIITEKAQDPLALLPLTEEEQRFTSQSVNSQAVLRMMGRGAPPLRGRGGGFDRGRGRGRGRGDGFMQRGVSYEEGEGGFGRPRGPRPEGWEEMGQKRFDRSFPSHYEETGNPQNPKMYQRSFSSENWRDRDEDDDNGDWRKAGGSKWNTRGNWRDGRERGFDYEKNPHLQKGFSRQYQRSRSSESWEEEEMPEWSTDADIDELGTFDANGAFVSTHSKQPFKARRPHGEGEHAETDGDHTKRSHSPEAANESQKLQKEKPPEKINSEEKDINENHMKKADNKKSVKNSDSPRHSPQTTKSSGSSPRPDNHSAIERDRTKDRPVAEKPREPRHSEHTLPNETKTNSVTVTRDTKQLSDKAPVKKAADKTEKTNSAIQKDIKVPENSQSAPVSNKRKSKQKSEAEALDQLQETVETMVAGMTVEEDECKEEEVVVNSTTTGALPPDHENYNKWFYRDPQGDLQGPFNCKEMAEWFSAGYFTMTLQVRRGCDEVFSPLGELIKRWGRVPFLPGQSPPPARNKPQPSPEVKEQQQQQQRRDQEQMQALQNFLFQQQLAQQQQIIRQLQLQQIQQMVVQLQENDEVKSLPLFQQQQLAMQMLLKHPQQLIMNQQQQPPPSQQKLSPRSPEQVADVNPATPKSPFPGNFNQEPSSIWDIEPKKSEPDNELQARLQKEMEEKDEYERRLQKKEEELKKRLEEMEREKQEVEKKKLELQRLEDEKKKQEEIQRKQEEEQRRQMEEERKRQVEEEKRRREEEKRRQLENEKQQEIKRQQEIQKQQEAQRLKEQEELEKQKQLELQRRQQEIQKQQELQQQEVMRKQQQEALHKLQQEQMASMQLPSHAQWGTNHANIPAQGQKTLLEIQQQEELERQEMEKVQRQQAELQRQQLLALQQQQQQQQQQKSWTNSYIKPQSPSTKSLLEIQDEQARQVERERVKREENQQQAAKNMSLGAASVWSASNPTPSNWANDGAWGALKQTSMMNKSNNSNSLGFWDDAIISTSAPVPQNNKKQSNKQGKPTADFPALGGRGDNKTKQTQQQTKAKPSKSRKDEEAAQRLFQSVKPVDDFTQWCEGQLRNMDTSVDIPTFIAFLQEVESPYEVHDYVRSYLGESKSAMDFAKSFLEKRSQYRNKGRPVEEDSIWGPAPAITPRELRQPIQPIGGEENQKGKAGKKKKSKMMKLDASILGFTVHAAPDRIVGEIDTEVSGGSAR